MKVPKLTVKEWETIRHLMLHCGNYDHCGLNEKQVKRLHDVKLKIPELAKKHWSGGKYHHEEK